MDDLVPVGEQLEELGRLRDELERHAQHERELERSRNVGLAQSPNKQGQQRDHEALARDHGAIFVGGDDLVDGRSEQT